MWYIHQSESLNFLAQMTSWLCILRSFILSSDSQSILNIWRLRGSTALRIGETTSKSSHLIQEACKTNIQSTYSILAALTARSGSAVPYKNYDNHNAKNCTYCFHNSHWMQNFFFPFTLDQRSTQWEQYNVQHIR